MKIKLILKEIIDPKIEQDVILARQGYEDSRQAVKRYAEKRSKRSKNFIKDLFDSYYFLSNYSVHNISKFIIENLNEQEIGTYFKDIMNLLREKQVYSSRKKIAIIENIYYSIKLSNETINILRIYASKTSMGAYKFYTNIDKYKFHPVTIMGIINNINDHSYDDDTRESSVSYKIDLLRRYYNDHKDEIKSRPIIFTKVKELFSARAELCRYGQISQSDFDTFVQFDY